MIKIPDCTIVPLINNQEHISVLAELWYKEISRHWVPNASVKRAKQKLIEHLNKDKMPRAFIALHNSQPIGMVCLRENDRIRPGIAPWLGSFDCTFRISRIQGR